MNNRKISEFLNEELVTYASYSTIRAIASLIDGQKNAQRKVLHTVLQKNIIKDIKVSRLTSFVSQNTEYLHGETSLEGVIVGLAKNYSGTNNIPLLIREGNFGTRFNNFASASRYIFTAQENILSKLFIKEDNAVLIKQEFEGTDIEPRFLIPTLPLILINGSDGIATGFAQKILPRNPGVIKDYIESYIKNDSIPELSPWYNGFDGIIEKGEKDNQWIIKGTFEKISMKKIIITELPIGYNLTSYTKVLDDLEDNKVIRSYKDQSENDKFKFEISVDSKFMKNDDEWIIQKLKLRKTVTENFTVIDENNKVKVYTSAEEVINHYIRIKMEFLQKRKNYLTESTKRDLLQLASKYIFIKGVTENTIIVNKKKKDEIISQLKTFDKIQTVDNSYDYLLRMPIYSLTVEKLDELLEQIKNKKSELQDIINKSIKDTWTEEISAV